MIRKTPEHLLMNSKSEYVQPCTVKEKYESQTGSWKNKQREKLTNIQKNASHKKLREKFGGGKITKKMMIVKIILIRIKKQKMRIL